MNRLIQLAVACVFVLVCADSGSAGLIVQASGGEKVVYDDLQNRYWYWNLDDFNVMNYADQIVGIGELNTESYFEQNTWHMVDSAEVQELLDNYTYEEIGAAFGFAYDNGSTWTSWSGRINESTAAGTHKWFIFDYYTSTGWAVGYLAELPDSSGSLNVSAWIATDAGAAAVPEPSSLVLLATGMLGLGGSIRRKRRVLRMHAT